MGELVLAVDVGGTKTAVRVADPTGAARTTVRFPTPGTAQATLELIERHCRALLAESPVAAVGVSFGGHVSGARVRSLHVPGWEDVDVVGTFSRLTGGAPVGVLNDAESGALAEYDAWQRRPEQPRSVFYLTVSTGIGGAVVIDGVVHRGARGLAGEIGHLPVGGSAPCPCGGTGHLESMAAGPAIARLARSGLSETRYADSALAGVRVLDARAVALAADDGDLLARETLRSAGVRLGTALVSVALCLDPEVICLGGGVAQSGPALWDPLRETLAAHPLLAARVERSVHGPDSALAGAVLLAGTLVPGYREAS